MSTTTHQLLPHLKLYPRDLLPYALVVGDPNRARDAAAFMSDVQELGNNREYLTVAGNYAGQRLIVASHGVGAGGANICFMELLRGGVRVLIRAGTCGALVKEIEDGDLIICTGAVREDGATDQLMPLPYPAVADRHIVEALTVASRKHGIPSPHEGLAVSAANLYNGILPPPWEKYVGYGASAVEMEVAPLLVLARMHGARAGAILTADGNLVRAPDLDQTYDPHREVVSAGKTRMLQVALEALAALSAREQTGSQ